MKKPLIYSLGICLSLILIDSVHASLLQDHFGVNLTLGSGQYDSYQNTITYSFNQSSFTPTKNTETCNYVVNDWYGHWSKTNMGNYKTESGQYVNGEEPYDVEAVYFDDDAQNLYVAVVTSMNPTSGRIENRLGSTLIVPGDLALDFGLNTPGADGFHYDYGINIAHETRPSGGNASMAENVLGTELYRTSTRDWYVGSPNNSASSNRLTNFDPNYRGFTGALLGNVDVNFYEYLFADGKQENGCKTYITEFTISRAMVGNPEQGQAIGVSYTPGCRNDSLPLSANTNVPEPATLILLLTGSIGLIRSRR